jgi:hypothetical protein
MRVASIYSILVVALLAASPARTAPRDPDLPFPDAPGTIRIVNRDDGVERFGCFVDDVPKTAVCAVEYTLLCYASQLLSWCSHARGTVDDIEFPSIRDRRGASMHYRVLSAKRFANRKEINRATLNGWEGGRKELRVGDVMIVVSQYFCSSMSQCSGMNDRPVRHFLRKTGDRWLVIGSHRPRYD